MVAVWSQCAHLHEWACTHVHMYIYLCIRTCMRDCMVDVWSQCRCLHKWASAHVHTYTNIDVYIHVCVNMWWLFGLRVDTFTDEQVRMYTCTHMLIYTWIYAWLHGCCVVSIQIDPLTSEYACTCVHELYSCSVVRIYSEIRTCMRDYMVAVCSRYWYLSKQASTHVHVSTVFTHVQIYRCTYISIYTYMHAWLHGGCLFLILIPPKTSEYACTRVHYMYTCSDIQMYLYIQTYMHLYSFSDVHVHVRMYRRTYIFICTYMYAWLYGGCLFSILIPPQISEYNDTHFLN